MDNRPVPPPKPTSKGIKKTSNVHKEPTNNNNNTKTSDSQNLKNTTFENKNLVNFIIFWERNGD